MAFDEILGERIKTQLDQMGTKHVEKRMFGCLGFMIADKMCIGVVNNELMLRVLPERIEKVLLTPNVRPMDFTGRPTKGFVFIEPEGFVNDEDLSNWVDIAVEFGKFGVVKSKKKK
ncbi:MAG: TfoX/Sxy family protein [Pyrinomonadaceae bacterium]